MAINLNDSLYGDLNNEVCEDVQRGHQLQMFLLQVQKEQPLRAFHKYL